VGAEQAVNRQPMIVATHERRARKAHTATLHEQLVTGQAVRPRMQERHAHHRAALATASCSTLGWTASRMLMRIQSATATGRYTTAIVAAAPASRSIGAGL
jgi:hypothetical protein